WFLTNLDAPLGRIIAIDMRAPDRARWKTVVPEAESRLQSASTVGRRFVLNYLQDAHSLIEIHGLDGKLQQRVKLPVLGTAKGLDGRLAQEETYFSFETYASPPALLRLEPASGDLRVFRAPELKFEPSEFESRQVFYQSKDGTRVPMTLSFRKGTTPDGARPVLLYGYGGFDISETPKFSPTWLAWMERGGVVAVANIRGGGEYGETWHQAGMKLKKQNVFDDFIAAAEWLIATKYTSPAKLAVQGGSNGGLLVGAVINQRPELFRVAIPQVGVMDMLRFHKFTIGWNWIADYGSSDNPDEFKALYAYSPLHNIKAGAKYPATLITTADHDDRVVPAHSFKYAATLQKAASKDNPVLIRIDTKSGHGASNVTKQIEATADIYAFIMYNLGVTPKFGS